jgi:hypothetical protein
MSPSSGSLASNIAYNAADALERGTDSTWGRILARISPHGGNVPATRPLLPNELRRKVPPALYRGVQLKTFWILFGFGFCLLGIYGNLVWPPGRNGWQYLLCPVVCPMIVACLHIFFPFLLNPYRSMSAKLSGMREKDKRDPDARRLVELLESAAARRFLLRSTLKLSVVLLATTVVGVAVYRPRLTWSIPLHQLGPCFVGVPVGSLIILQFELLAWAFKNWPAHSEGAAPESTEVPL